VGRVERLTLRADPGSWPFWDDDDVGAVDPDELGLPPELLAELDAWTLRLDRVDGWFEDAQERRLFDADGRALWLRIAEALAGHVKLSYRQSFGKESEPPPF
jgi:hypothetical protein